MSNTLIATIGGLVALFFWGIANWQESRLSKKFSPFTVNLMVQYPGLVVMIPVMIFSHASLPSLGHGLTIIVAGIIFSAAYTFYIKAFSVGDSGVVAPLAATFPIVTLFFSILFLSTNFSQAQILSIITIVAGVFLLAAQRRNNKISLKQQHQATLFALITSFLWGFGNFVQNTVIDKEAWPAILLCINIAMVGSALALLAIMKRDKFWQETKIAITNKVGAVTGTTITFGSFGFYVGSTKAGSVIIPAVVASSSPLVTAGLSRLIDKEKLTLIKRVGAVIVVTGIIMLNAL